VGEKVIFVNSQLYLQYIVTIQKIIQYIVALFPQQLSTGMPSKKFSSSTSSSRNLLPTSATRQDDAQPPVKSALLDTLNAISGFRERKELFATIIEKVKPVIPMDDTGLLVLDKTGHHWQDWTNVDNYQDTKAATQLQQMGYDGWLPVDRWMEYTLHHTGIMTVAQFRERYPEHPFGAVMWEAGLRETIFTPLLHRGKTLGVLFFNSAQDGTYTVAHLPLFKTIADLVATAIANILANEEILEREQEKSVLLSISNDIASVRGKEDLLHLVLEKIKPLFGFYDCGILVIDKQNRFRDLAVVHTEIDPSEANLTLRELGFYEQGQGLPYPDSALEWTIRQIEEKGHPVIFNYLADYSHFSDGALLEQLRQLGYREGLAGQLRIGGRCYGCLFINFQQEGQADRVSLPLFQNVADQLSVAVANIMANEEILEREREKANLLNISQHIAAVQDRRQLLGIIYSTIQEFFPFDNAGLFIVDESKRCHYELIDESVLPTPIEQAIAAAPGRGPFPHEGSPVEAWMEKGPLIIGDVVEESILYPHPQWQVLIEHGVRQIIAGPLQSGGRKMGMLCFNSFTPDRFKTQRIPLFQAIADQLSIAVANILANEEILERERKNQMLLDICNAAATIRDKKQLLRIIFEKVKPVYDIADVGLYLIDADKDVCLDWSTAYPDITASPLGYRLSRLNISKMPYKGSIIEWAVKVAEAAEKPVVFPLTPELGNQWPGFLQLAAQMDEGYKECLFTTLRASGTIIGTLDFHSRQNNYFSRCDHSLFQAVADQVAMTLASMLASEEIASKADEIKRLNQELLQQNSYLIEEVKTHYNFEEIVGSSRALEDVFNSITLVAPSDTSVLIAGETGTGKELIARAIHNGSHRRHKPLIKLNCAALPAQLIESELFGHEKGAFTGAIDRRIGKFEVAAGSTLFLDEIGEMPLELQAKLLRALQEKEIERLGSNRVIKTDVRIIAATNRNLLKEVAEGRFRQDLYYRLSVFPIHLPSLRERREDIPVLATHFVGKMNKKLGKNLQGVSNKVLQELLAYAWPGNIRELEHVIERSAILCKEQVIREVQLPGKIGVNHPESPPSAHPKTLAEIEKAHIVEILQQCNGRVRGPGGAAELLDIHPNTLDFRMKKLGISKHVIVK
jgi:transcriptional regulator with GAF, ATPase, and Fis domain